MQGISISRGTKVAIVSAGILIGGIIYVNAKSTASCSGEDACCAKENTAMVDNNAQPVIACKLTSKEMQQRKETVIADLKKGVIERKELPNGYSYKFNGDDATLDKLTEFIKTERACCGFFTFNLSINEDYAHLDLTGPDGAKDFVNTEIGL